MAWLIAGGVDPGRILLLTFTRRAAAEMLRRAETLLHRLRTEKGSGLICRGTEKGSGLICAKHPEGRSGKLDPTPFPPATRPSGAEPTTRIATRLLHRYGKSRIGLPPQFTVHDRSDSEGPVERFVRTELNLREGADRRFPKKGTCMAIYSRCVNAQQKLDEVLAEPFSLVQRLARRVERSFRRLRRSQGNRLRARL